MFAKIAIVASVFAAFAAALPTEPSNNQCQTSDQFCCDSVQQAGAPDAKQALSLVDAVVGANVLVGLACSPVGVLAIQSSCQQTQQPVCCNGNNFNGAVVVGCSPINV